MSIVSYAQNFEDVLLWRALGHVQNGRYIDIGAQDPDIDSISRAFYERGWRGVSVEPLSSYAERLRAARPEDTLIQAVVTDAPGPLPFFGIENTGLSTLSRDIAEEHRAKGFTVTESSVATTTLDEILDSQSDADVHWLKIDVEGAECDVLKSWKHSTMAPWVVVIEATYPNSPRQTHAEWEALILAKGYRFAHWDGLNRYYVAPGREALVEVLAAGPNYWDGFQLPEASWAVRDVANQIASTRNQLAIATEEKAKLQQQLSETRELIQSMDQRRAVSEEFGHKSEILVERMASTALMLQPRIASKTELLVAEKNEQTQLVLEEAARIARHERDQERVRYESESVANNALRGELVKLKDAFERKTIEIANLQRTHESIKSQLVIAQESLAKEVDAQQKASLESQKIRSLYDNETARWKATEIEVADLRKSLDGSLRELNDLRNELNLQGERADIERKKADEYLAQLEIQRAALATEAAAHESTRIELATARKASQRALEVIAAQEATHSKIAIELFSRNDSLHKLHLSATEQLDRVVEKCEQLTKDLAVARDALSTEETAHSITRDTLVALQAKHDSLSVELHSTPSMLEHAKSNVSMQERVIEQHLTAALQDEMQAMTLNQLLSLPQSNFLRSSYRLLLGREPDSAGFAHYKSRLLDGASRESVVADLAMSSEAEGVSEFSSLSDSEFISHIYHTVLGRSPDPQGAKHYSVVIKQLGRAWASRDIKKSSEAKIRSPESALFAEDLERLIKEELRARKWWRRQFTRPHYAKLIRQSEARLEDRLEELDLRTHQYSLAVLRREK